MSTEPLSLPRRGVLAGEVIAAYARVSWLLWRNDLRAAVGRLRADAATTRVEDPCVDDPYSDAVRLGQAVSRVLRVLPADSRCLRASLVLTALLSRRGISSSLVIGVRPSPDFGAHAWVEHRGRPLLAAGPRRYRRLVEL